MSKLKIKRGDNVIITTGKKDIKGKTGEVIEVIKKEGRDPRVVVAGLNIIKSTLSLQLQILKEESLKEKLLFISQT